MMRWVAVLRENVRVCSPTEVGDWWCWARSVPTSPRAFSMNVESNLRTPPAQLCWAAADNRIVLAELSRRAAVAVICGRTCAAVMATIGDRDRRSRLSLAAGMLH